VSSFFDSEVVRESLFELDDLQNQLFIDIMNIPFLDKEGKREHLDRMREFLEKQKLFIFRLSLSDDPEAVEMKEKIMDSARMFGLKENQNINDFFNLMETSIKNIEDSLDI
jgi:hypothetical protein